MVITSELTNQSARKALLTCVVYSNTGNCLITSITPLKTALNLVLVLRRSNENRCLQHQVRYPPESDQNCFSYFRLRPGDETVRSHDKGRDRSVARRVTDLSEYVHTVFWMQMTRV